MLGKTRPKKALSNPTHSSSGDLVRAIRSIHLPIQIKKGMKILPESEWPDPSLSEILHLAGILGSAFQAKGGERALVFMWECAVTRYQFRKAIQGVNEKDNVQRSTFRAQLGKDFGFDPYDFPDGISHEDFLKLVMPVDPDKLINGKRVRTREGVWLEFLRDSTGMESDEEYRSNTWPSPNHILSGARLFKKWIKPFKSGRATNE
jgi:hypothetical protein